MSEAPEAEAIRWPLVKRIAFRFALIYFLLYALPFPVTNLWGTFTGLCAQFEVTARTEGWEWMASVNEVFYGDPKDPDDWGPYHGMWKWATRWGGGLLGYEVIFQRTGSGDTAFALVKMILSLCLAAFLALVWSFFFRRKPAYPRLGRWLHLGVRWYLAFVLLSYGMIKFYAGQFSYPGLWRLMNPIGDTSPMGMVWTFMGLSKPYEVFSGIGETLAGLLLFSRRTSLLGSLVSIAVMTNVCMLNWMYDVPVKLFSTHLLLFSMLLTLPDAPRLWRVFFANREAAPARLRLTDARWFNWAFGIFGLVWVGTHLYVSHENGIKSLERRAVTYPQLYGIWEVEKHLRDGEEVPRTDVTRWKRIAFDARERGWVASITDARTWFKFKEANDLATVSVSLMRGTGATTWDGWTLTHSTKMVKGRHPAPARMSDFRVRVDIEREAMVVKGKWRGSRIEVHLLKKTFTVQRGFHLVQELPFNR